MRLSLRFCWGSRAFGVRRCVSWVVGSQFGGTYSVGRRKVIYREALRAAGG